MSVTVDDQPMRTESLGLTTVGQVLSHLRKENRLVVNLLIDGREPDLDGLGHLKQSPLCGHTIYIETADPRKLALDVLGMAQDELIAADRLRAEAVELLQTNQSNRALERLGKCIYVWNHARDSVVKTAQLLRIDLERIEVDGKPMSQLAEAFADQLRSIKTALENRDFVALADALGYEATQTCRQWTSAIQSIRATIE